MVLCIHFWSVVSSLLHLNATGVYKPTSFCVKIFLYPFPVAILLTCDHPGNVDYFDFSSGEIIAADSLRNNP